MFKFKYNYKNPEDNTKVSFGFLGIFVSLFLAEMLLYSSSLTEKNEILKFIEMFLAIPMYVITYFISYDMLVMVVTALTVSIFLLMLLGLVFVGLWRFMIPNKK